MYHQGQIPARVDMAGIEKKVDAKKYDNDDEGEEKDCPKVDKRAVYWKIPIDKWDNQFIAKYLPIFATGLREKQEPQVFLATEGFTEIVMNISCKQLIANLRGIVYPLRDALATLDDDVCVKTLRLMLAMSQRVQKIPLKRKGDDEDDYGDEDTRKKKKKRRYKTINVAEAFVEYFNILLPTMEVLKNRNSRFFNKSLPKKKVYGAKMKLEAIKKIRDVPDIEALC